MNFANAQRTKTSLWFTVQTPVNFSKHWQWHNDGGYRTLGISAEPAQYYYRTGLRYNYDRPWSAAAGVAFFYTRTSFSDDNNEFGHEFRFWEEISHMHLFNEKLQGLFRFRTEQRFFAETSIKERYTGYRFRLRPGLNQKLNDRWSLQLTDEYMQQAAHDKFSFDQNRLTFSGIYHFNKTTQLQTGYMWLMWPKDDQHILTITFTKNISIHGS
jgi:hypothetical protein